MLIYHLSCQFLQSLLIQKLHVLMWAMLHHFYSSPCMRFLPCPTLYGPWDYYHREGKTNFQSLQRCCGWCSAGISDTRPILQQLNRIGHLNMESSGSSTQWHNSFFKWVEVGVTHVQLYQLYTRLLLFFSLESIKVSWSWKNIHWIFHTVQM